MIVEVRPLNKHDTRNAKSRRIEFRMITSTTEGIYWITKCWWRAKGCCRVKGFSWAFSSAAKNRQRSSGSPLGLASPAPWSSSRGFSSPHSYIWQVYVTRSYNKWASFISRLQRLGAPPQRTSLNDKWARFISKLHQLGAPPQRGADSQQNVARPDWARISDIKKIEKRRSLKGLSNVFKKHF